MVDYRGGTNHIGTQSINQSNLYEKGNHGCNCARNQSNQEQQSISQSERKCRWLEDEVGYDATINYREENIDEALARVCPDGIDVYFDNVGGDLLEPVLNHINYQARIPFCGAVADYADEDGTGPKNLFRLVANCARLEGFMTHYWVEDYEAARDVLVGWLNEGKIKNFEERMLKSKKTTS